MSEYKQYRNHAVGINTSY